ncbi:MAG: SpoIIE family protein phosphatase, partial [Acidobacteria bacterium]|nr:SpoIIE family protein phosphatase [Acidobacteriota bacterium]
ACWSCRALASSISHRWLSGERLTIHTAQRPSRDLEKVKKAILADPGIVESGLFALDAHLRAGNGGLIDLLAVDGSRALTLLEIDRTGEDDLLARSLDHHSWAVSQIHFLRRLYGPDRIHPFRTPRGILLARDFSSSFLRKIADLPTPLLPLVYRLRTNGRGPLLCVESTAELPPTRLAHRVSQGLAGLAASAGLPTPEELAAGVHRNLMPHTCPPVKGYDIAGITLPCRAVGGDTYDFLLRSGNRLWVMVGDVAGKGHSAALIMSHFQAMLRGLARTERPLFQQVARLNDILSQALPLNEFISFFVLELEPHDGLLRYVNAGHNPPVLMRASGEVEFLNGSGPVLGVLPGSAYPAHETRLAKGDTILLYTDGATESQNPGQEEFGEERLVRCLRQVVALSSSEGLSRLEESILKFCGSAPRYDDITLLLVRRIPV